MGMRLGCAALFRHFLSSAIDLWVVQDSPVPHREGSDGASQKDAKVLKELQEKEPPKKYRLTEPMKSIFWQLYCLSNECSRMTNEKK